MQNSNFKVYNTATEADLERARQAASSTYTERFYMLMRLIKVSAMIKNAKIISSPQLPKK